MGRDNVKDGIGVARAAEGPALNGHSRDSTQIFDANRLRSQLARDAIELGLIPGYLPVFILREQGSSGQCAVCGLPLRNEDAGYRLEYALDNQELTNCHVHGRCFISWESECGHGTFARSAYNGQSGPADGQTSSSGKAPTLDQRSPDDAPCTLGGLLFQSPSTIVPELEWTALVRGIAAGNQTALRDLYDRSHRIAFTLIMRIVKDRQTAEEVTLDVYHEVWKRAADYDAANGSVARLDPESSALKGHRSITA